MQSNLLVFYHLVKSNGKAKNDLTRKNGHIDMTYTVLFKSTSV